MAERAEIPRRSEIDFQRGFCVRIFCQRQTVRYAGRAFQRSKKQRQKIIHDIFVFTVV